MAQQRPTHEVFRQQPPEPSYDKFVAATSAPATAPPQQVEEERAPRVDRLGELRRDDQAYLAGVARAEREDAVEEMERERREGDRFRKERTAVKRRVDVADGVRGRRDEPLVGSWGLGAIVKKRRVGGKVREDDDVKKDCVERAPLVSGYSSSSEEGDEKDIYNVEPPTTGRIILHTTHGPLQIDLWTVEAPVTCKNLIQHALDGYYNQLPFHRVVPQVLVQTGDPSSTGNGGTAALGDPAGYPRELHGRLKFRRRGLVAMVCEDAVARSQFFITLAPAEWLIVEVSIFGSVGGDTIYNLLNLGANPVDGFDVHGAPRVTGVTIVENPFKELRARERKVAVEGKKHVVANAKRAVRSRNLLSFADSDSEDEEVIVEKRRPSRFGEAKVRDAPKRKEEVRATGEEKAGEDDEIIRKANEEFARLKAQLDGGDEAENGERKDDADGRKGSVDGARDRGRDAIAAAVRRKRRDESDTLRRLKAFEGRVVKSRRDARKDERGRTTGAWFERGLRLATQAMEEEEYEVRFAKPKVKSRR